jgi:glycosyltransferase-like protein LARGE
MENWEGPVIVVLYVTDGEALRLPQMIASSDVLQNRKNIAYHIVYKRGVSRLHNHSIIINTL